MSETDEAGAATLEVKSRPSCSCATAVLETKSLKDDVRLIKFIGVTDAKSNEHRFPHAVMEQMVRDSKMRHILPYFPASVKEIDQAALAFSDEFASKTTGTRGEPIPLRNMHSTGSQFDKVGRILSIDLKSAPDPKAGKGVDKKWMEVVAEVHDPAIIKLLDRKMVTKFSIGFRHKYDVVDGVKVSNYGEIDHWGIVDAPADPDARLLEVKADHTGDTKTMADNADCVQTQVAGGMSQEDATKYCASPEGKQVTEKALKMAQFMVARKLKAGRKDDTAPFSEGAGDPGAGDSESFNDCVAGLVSTGLDKAAAEAACRGKPDSSDRSQVDTQTPTEQPSSAPTMQGKSMTAEQKALKELTTKQDQRIRALELEAKQSQVAAEVGILEGQGRATPATKADVYGFAMSLPGEVERKAYYRTLPVAVKYGEEASQNGGGNGSRISDADMEEAGKAMWGEPTSSVVAGFKNRSGRRGV